jgi:hypothetical protein
MADNAKTVEQLRALLQLTQTEIAIAQTRISQARTDAVRRELVQNSEKARDRAVLIAETLRDLGGVPDVLTPALGRLTALFKAGVDQVEPLSEALLQDLQLEHQLLDRARYLKVLAQTSEQPKVARLADRLVTAHTATVEWLTTVLAEEALGGPAALAPTPLQRVAGTVTRVVNVPSRYAVERVNRTVDSVQQSTEQALDRLGNVPDKASALTDAVRDVVLAGRNASLQRAERIARREGDRGTARTVRETRRDLGVLSASELPVKGYDQLSQADVIAAVKKLTKVADVRAVVAYEEKNKNRSSVVSAGQTRVAALAKEAVGVR